MVDDDWKYIYFYNNRHENFVYLNMPVGYMNWVQPLQMLPSIPMNNDQFSNIIQVKISRWNLQRAFPSLPS